jgi:hypothetical protein
MQDLYEDSDCSTISTVSASLTKDLCYLGHEVPMNQIISLFLPPSDSLSSLKFVDSVAEEEKRKVIVMQERERESYLVNWGFL